MLRAPRFPLHRTSASAVGSAAASVALVRPAAFQILHSLSYFGAIPPIGLAYIAAALREDGHTVTVVDGVGLAADRLQPLAGPVRSLYRHGLQPAEIVEQIPHGTELVGITHMFLHEWPDVREIIVLARRKLPHARIIVGGENATATHARILATTPELDACALGEGEPIAREAAARVASGRSLEGIPGLVTRSAPPAGDRAPGKSDLAPRLGTLAGAPRPAWDLFPLDAYFRSASQFGVHRGRSMPILATRGCPFRCTFCSSPSMWTTRYVTRPPEEVVAEMADLAREHAVVNFDFCDLTAIVKRSWILEFCQRLRDSGLEVSWQLPVGTRSEALDREVLQGIHDTGCRNITYAPESGSEALLKAMRKQVRLPKLRESLRDALAVGLVVRLNFILGHPRETRSDAWATWRLLLACAWMGCQDASVMIFSPYPGSADYDELRASGELGDEEEDALVALARSGRSSRTFSRSMGRAEVLGLQWLMLVSFYAVACVREPLRLPRILRGLLSGLESSHVEQLFRTKIGLFRAARRGAPVQVPAATGEQGLNVGLPVPGSK